MHLRKDPPIKNRELLRELKVIIGRCEWPDGCHRRRPLDTAHIRARGMGGGRRKDVPGNLIVLCRNHHQIYDQQMGQSPANQELMREAISKRTAYERQEIAAFLAAQKYGSLG